MTHRHVVRRGAHSKKAAIGAIADALSFPDWFGHNLDALYDATVQARIGSTVEQRSDQSLVAVMHGPKQRR